MNFNNPYKPDDLLLLLKEFLPDFQRDIRNVKLPQANQNVHKARFLGISKDLDLSVFELAHAGSVKKKVSLAQDGFRIIKDHGSYRALGVFYSDNVPEWRLSLMLMTPSAKETGKIKLEFSNPRRYSFFLGPDTKTHTPEEYLIQKGRVKDFEDLKSRFSIEVVNKEFYTQIAVLFTKLAGGKRTIGGKSIDEGSGCLRLPSTTDDTVRKEFAVRLIGRLVFCWFLKKKSSERGLPLLPEELLSSKAVTDNYYHHILEPLLFQALNTPMSERLDDYCQKPWNIIPFLNGGLFTPHSHDFYDPGALGISTHINTLKLPDSWFKELFAIFETYNFTIDENTSVDVELSIEPEMLGRIFENLLAEINPETGETARKKTGSYYTPRAIVEYMVDESLKQYLLTKTKLTEDKITSLLSYEVVETVLSESEKESVIDSLDTIKIIDPACGSGAFPMGILQKMLLVLQKVDPNSQRWFSKTINKIENGIVRRDLEGKLKSENFNYIHKLGIIQSSIYGSDIQPIAVDISKLRFFLSLIVDEEVHDSRINRGVKHLPNLEFKFVCANSLIGLPKLSARNLSKDAQVTMLEATGDIGRLKELREEYLQSYGSKKAKIQEDFQKIQQRMFKHSLGWGGHESQTRQLSMWEPFSYKQSPWFDPEWMFGIVDGFDITIGNPPYVRADEQSDWNRLQREKILESKQYETLWEKWDLYIPFIERSYKLLRPNGVSTLIVSDAFCHSKYAKKPQKWFLKNARVLRLDFCADVQIFDAAVHNVIYFFQRADGASWKPERRVHRATFGNVTLLPTNDQAKLTYRAFFPEDRVHQTFSCKTIQLDSICYISVGMVINADEKSAKGAFLTGELISPVKDKLHPKAFVEGKNLTKWTFSENSWIEWGTSRAPHQFRRQTFPELYEHPEKLMLPMVGEVRGAIDTEQLYCNHGIFVSVPWHQLNGVENRSLKKAARYRGEKPPRPDLPNREELEATSRHFAVKYLLGVINSVPARDFLRANRRNNVQLYPDDWKKLPIPDVPAKKQAPIIALVDAILTAKRRNPLADVSAMEREVDEHVSRLYGLTKEEIEVVENANRG